MWKERNRIKGKKSKKKKKKSWQNIGGIKRKGKNREKEIRKKKEKIKKESKNVTIKKKINQNSK